MLDDLPRKIRIGGKMPTIAAIATSLSKSAISITRLCGDKAYVIAQKIVRRRLTPRYATLCNAYDKNGNIVDKLICLYFKAPHSFNGEDIIEFQSHGGLVVAKEILHTCMHYGARIAQPGEFSKIALKNNKIDLLQLQAMVSMINNTSACINRSLVRNLNGELKDLLDESRLKMIEVMAQLELHIDYAEEDLDKNILSNASVRLRSITSRFRSILHATSRMSKLQGMKVSIIGKPNVGKSSVLNMILMESRAITSDIEGTTRDVITEYIDIGGHMVQIADTAGIRTSEDHVESMGIEKTFEIARKSDLLLCVFDKSTEMDRLDMEVLEFAKTQDARVVIVLNKEDLGSKIQHDFSGFDTISVSALNRDQGGLVRDMIASSVRDYDTHELVLMNALQESIFTDSVSALEKALFFLEDAQLELASFELSEALKLINDITQPYNVEDMLDAMFSQFCVGK